MSFIYRATIQLHHTDAAGILFFANQLVLAHDAYQALVESLGVRFVDVLSEGKYLLPLVHCESDYLTPLRVGDKIELLVDAERIGTTSFTLGYRVQRAGEIVGTAKTVHVWIERGTLQSVPLPDWFAAALTSLGSSGEK